MPHGHIMPLHAGLTAVVWRVSYLIGGGGRTVYPPLGRARGNNDTAKMVHTLTYRHVVGGRYSIYSTVYYWGHVRLNRWSTSCPHSWSLEAATQLLLHIVQPEDDGLFYSNLDILILHYSPFQLQPHITYQYFMHEYFHTVNLYNGYSLLCLLSATITSISH